MKIARLSRRYSTAFNPSELADKKSDEPVCFSLIIIILCDMSKIKPYDKTVNFSCLHASSYLSQRKELGEFDLTSKQTSSSNNHEPSKLKIRRYALGRGCKFFWKIETDRNPHSSNKLRLDITPKISCLLCCTYIIFLSLNDESDFIT